MNSLDLTIRGIGKGYVFNKKIVVKVPRTLEQRRQVAKDSVWCEEDGNLVIPSRQVMGAMTHAISMCEMKISKSSKRAQELIASSELQPEFAPLLNGKKKLDMNDVILLDDFVYYGRTGQSR